MADRFWVGGTGNINDTARWAATSGGAGGQSVPTAADNAFFDGLSDRLATQSVTSITRVSTTATVTCNNHGYSAGNTVTISGASQTEYNGTFTISNVATNTFDYTVTGTPATPATGTITVARRAAFTVTINATFSCLSFIVGDGVAATALTQAMTLAGSSDWNIYGSLFFPATNFTRTNTNNVYFLALTTGNIITLNGSAITSGTPFFGVVGGVTYGEWTLGSSGILSSGANSAAYFYSGIFNTANYNVTSVSFIRGGGPVGTLVLNLGSSTLTATGGNAAISFSANTNFTINPGTSQITTTASTFSLHFGSGLNYYNVTLAGTTESVSFGTTTFNNLTLNNRTSTGLSQVFFSGNVTVAGTLSLHAANTNPIRRAQIVSETIGVPRTITAAAVTIGDGMDFRDITIAGAAAPFNASTKSTGDLKGNSGIIFPAAKTVYWNLAGTQNWSATGWATTSTGTPAAANFPLAQDTAVFTEVGAAGTVTIDSAYWHLGTLTFDDGVSPRSSGVTISFLNNCFTFYGNLKLSSGVVFVGSSGPITFSGKTSQTITTVGKTILNPIILDSPGGSLTLADNVTIDAQYFNLTRGTLDLSNRVLTARYLTSNNLNTRAIAFGTSGRISLIGNDTTVVDFNYSTNFSFSGTSDVQLTYTGSTGVRFIRSGSGSGATENSVLNYRISAGLDTVVMYTENFVSSYRNLTFEDAFSGVFGSLAGNAYREPGTAYGNVRFSPNMTFVLGTDFTIAATSSTQQLTMSGLTFPRSITKSGAGSLQLMDNLTLAASRTFTHTAGSVLLNGKILTTPVYSTSNTNARTLAFGTGELVLNGTGTVWNAATSNGLSISAGTGVIRITDTSATGKTFAGGGVQTYPDLRIEGGTSTSTITLTGANRFSKMTNARTVGYTIVFPNETTTFNAWGLSGTDGNLVTLSRTGGSGQFTIQSGSSGLLIAQFVSISNSIFLPSGNGYAIRSTNGGGNNGWVFGAPTFGKFLVFFNP